MKTQEEQSVVSLNSLMEKSLESQGILMMTFIECASDDFEEIYLFNMKQVTQEDVAKKYKCYQETYGSLAENATDEDLTFDSWMRSKGIECEKLVQTVVKPCKVHSFDYEVGRRN